MGRKGESNPIRPISKNVVFFLPSECATELVWRHKRPYLPLHILDEALSAMAQSYRTHARARDTSVAYAIAGLAIIASGAEVRVGSTKGAEQPR